MPLSMRTIRLVAPSSPFDRDRFEAGVQRLVDLGFEPRFRKDIFEKTHYVAGNASRRLSELQEAFDDPEAGVIMCIRGGYGISQLMRTLHQWAPRLQKTLVGFSDVTLLHLLTEEWGWRSLYSPMAASPAFITMSEAWLRQWMLLIDGCERDVSYTFQPDFLKPKVRTKIQAKLVGGNFRMLIDSLGTPWQLRFTGPSILFLEEIGESAYAIDRLWAHLENAVDLSNLRAVLWGQCTDCKDHENALEMIRARSPILHVDGFPVGHGDISHAVMLNVRAELDASPDGASLRYLP